ncbi:MAG: hypothetical protein KC620_26145, partial [Myxococcales bacterium]|nr:hypothetical protein [Myxococcales bacterium]
RDTEIRRVLFPNDPTAHFCSADEVMVAIAKGRYDANNAGAINASTWTVAEIGRSQARNANNSLEVSCQGLMYNSADVANGTQITVRLNYRSNGNGGGVTGSVVEMRQEIACGTNMPVLCCR